MDSLSLVGEDGGELRRQLIEEFTIEALEHLDTAESLLVAAENGELAAESQAELLRAMHSIKGAAAYLGLKAIQQLAHALETAAQRLWSGAIPDSSRLGPMLDGTAELRRLVEHAWEPACVSESLLAALESMGYGSGTDSCSVRRASRRSIADVFLDVADQQLQALQAACQRLAEDGNDATAVQMLQRALSSLRSAAEYAGKGELIELLDRWPRQGEKVEPESLQRFVAELQERLHPSPDTPSHTAGAGALSAQSTGENGTADPDAQPTGIGRTLRVAQTRVDLLIEQAGELVTVRNQLDHFFRSLEAEGCSASVCRQGKALGSALGRIADDIQSLAMELRLVRLDTLFRRLPRVTRDLAARLGKRVRLETAGGNVELDKGIAEAIADPLIHMVRNAIDHGLEPPDARAALGKRSDGLVRVAARREANLVVVTVEDDGRGVDVEAVRAAAVTKNVLDREAAAALSAEGIYDLLFLPGFSTASKVSDVSGRGVGLDVVRSNVSRFGGNVTMWSEPGAGTRIEMRLPVRLAARHVVLVRVGSNLFAVPLDAIRETMSVCSSQVRKVAGRAAIVHHGKIVPLLPLSEPLGITDPHQRNGTLEMILVDLGMQSAGLIVDEICQHYQVVVKPLESYLATAGVDGAAVLADGRVVLVIDPLNLLATM